MQFGTQARADWRVLVSAALIGSGVGMALGAAYLAGGMAGAANDHTRAERIAESAAGSLSETALQQQAAGGDPSVLRLAQSHDPFGRSDAEQRQLASFDSQLQHQADQSLNAGPAKAQRELDCMTDAVYFEARGETARGQEAVAQVVMNRLKKPGFPKTVCGVVFQGASHHGCQFSFACDGSMRHGLEADAWERARHIASRALSGFVLRDVGQATHFHTVDVAPDWGPQMMRVAQVGLHVFYRLNPHARVAPDAMPERAVMASAPETSPPQLRLAPALSEKPADGAAAGAAAPSPADVAKADVKPAPKLPEAAPAGLTKAADPQPKAGKIVEASAS